MKNLTNTAITIFCLCVIYTSLSNAQHLQNVNEAEQIDINTKAQELGITTEQLKWIMNSAANYNGGDPLPEAIQERFFTGQAAGDVFGSSVASAGDVNGDGYDDIIVGAPNNDAGGNNAGRAYIYFGGTIVNQIADVILTGSAAVDLFGISVSSAGDVNGDGFSDVIVGATGNDAGGLNAGAAYIFFGGADMDNVADVILTGEAASDNFGVSVSSCGDVNGDGFSDVIVGATGNDAGGSNAGRAYIYFGGAVMNNVVDLILTGAAGADNFGISVSGAGDVNGDGYADVIVGAPFNDAGGSNAGRAYLYFGGESMDNTSDVIFTGTAGGDNFGISVSGAGDVNGDGYEDVIVGAYLNDAGGSNAGRAFIYFGGAVMDNVADALLTGAKADDWFGRSVSGAGDVNGDGYADVIVGAELNDAGGIEAGRAYIFYGGEIFDSIPDIIITGETAGDQFGYSVSKAGDVNGDGYADVIVGANLNDAGGSNAGRAYLYLNSLTGTDIPDEAFTGEVVSDRFGFSVSSAGDVNGDGYTDVIVGANLNDAGGNNAGRAYIYFGGQTVNNIANLILTGEAINDQFGYSVSTAGDLNGDGYSDVIVGAPGNDSGGSNAGRAYIYFGGPFMNNIADVILTGAVAGNSLGISVANAGDVNGDGYSDIIVGADGYNSFTGRAYIYFGGASMDNIADVILTGAATSDLFGGSVSTAGDVNGDTYSDVIVGAKSNDANGTDAGRAYIYFGGINMDNIADVILSGEASGDWFGNSVSSAGDVNGDGYSDVIVGAELNDAGGSNSGRAYIFFGGLSMDNTSDVIITGATDTEQFGYSVSGAGDVNNDGYSDVIVGAPGNDAGGNSAGRAYIYFGGTDMDNIVDIISTGSSPTENYGYSVSSAGDVNGDGFDDVIVGGPLISAGLANLYLSSPPIIKPSLRFVKDIPNDQGGFVRVRWNRSGYDVPGQNRIADYILQRSDPPGTSGFVWDYVATIPAIREFEYSYVSPTPSDSFSNSSGTFYFRVIARGTHPDELWYSNIKYGHSVDNLSPAAPQNFYANLLVPEVKLGWKANTEPDLYNYVIYRTDAAGANPDTLDIYAQVFDTTYIDTNPLSGTSYYFLRAQDVHNNLSPYTSATVSAQSTFSLSVNVNNGWNMVSIPGLHPADQNVNTWWQYREQTANVFKYSGGYVVVTSVEPGTGYWMKHAGQRTYNTGDEWPAIQIVTHNPITASAGWNMFGGYEEAVQVSALTTTPPGLINGPVYGYAGGYFTPSTLQPGYGYWVKLNGSGQINIPDALAKGEEEHNDWFKEDWGRIVISDASGNKFTLYSVTSEVNLNNYELPPSPPTGMFDIRYSSGRIAEDINSSMKTIDMSGVTYPLTIRVEGVDIRLTDESGKMLNASLKAGEEVVIESSTITKLMVSGEILPTAFSLAQNYPNPFNPTTTIQYSIPQRSNVSLKVYDVLGNEITTLVNEEKDRGVYSVNFDASQLASGIYLYRIQAGSFAETKKMILLR